MKAFVCIVLSALCFVRTLPGMAQPPATIAATTNIDIDPAPPNTSTWVDPGVHGGTHALTLMLMQPGEPPALLFTDTDRRTWSVGAGDNVGWCLRGMDSGWEGAPVIPPHSGTMRGDIGFESMFYLLLGSLPTGPFALLVLAGELCYAGFVLE